MTIDNFIDLNYSPINLLEEIYEVAYNGFYYLSPSKVYRADITGQLKSKIQNNINVEISDCGILKSLPNSTYQYHVDEFREVAINMLIVEPNSKHVTKSIVGITPTLVPYRKNFYMMLNVTKLHMTFNKDIKYRYIMSIGFKNISYNTMLKMHQERALIK